MDRLPRPTAPTPRISRDFECGWDGRWRDQLEGDGGKAIEMDGICFETEWKLLWTVEAKVGPGKQPEKVGSGRLPCQACNGTEYE